jgi:hypothetical protein
VRHACCLANRAYGPELDIFAIDLKARTPIRPLWVFGTGNRVHLAGLQRLFSMFPTGWPGFALLLLRASVAVSPLLGTEGHSQHHPYWYIFVLVLATALCCGFLTPLAALVVFALQLNRFGHGGLETLVFLFDALSLSMLGPGAYSVDAYRFGRRLVELPPGKRESRG